jgi:hypothetical protein
MASFFLIIGILATLGFAMGLVALAGWVLGGFIGVFIDRHCK